MPSFLDKLLKKRFDPSEFATLVGGRWTITPGVFYPAMVRHIHGSLQIEELPPELVDRVINPEVDPLLAARRYRNWARTIEPEAWRDALTHINKVPEKRLVKRAEALECCRLWFTRALKNNEKPPISIHILKDEGYRLGVNVELRAG